MLAVLGGIHQRFDDGAVAAGAVERLLDGQHLWVLGRLPNEVFDRVERIEWVMQQHVAGGDRRKNVVLSTKPGHRPRRVRRHSQLVETDKAQQFEEPGHVEQAVDRVHLAVVLRRMIVAGVDLFFVDQCLPQFGMQVRRDFEPHRLAPLPLAQTGFDGPHHVVAFLFQQLEVHVAGDAKFAGRDDLVAAKQLGQPTGDEVLDRHKLLAIALLNRQETGQHGR